MRLPSRALLTFVVPLLSAFASPLGLACSCFTSEQPSSYELVKQSVDRADSVFLGIPTVLHGDGKSDETQDLVVFNVLETFKGKQRSQVGIHSGVDTTEILSCGYSFEIGKTYLVFANQYSGGLFEAACSFTAPLERSGTALRLLRKEPPQPEDLLTPAQIERSSKGRILGTVRRADGVPLFRAKIYIWSDSDSSYERPGWPTNEEWPGDNDGSLAAFLLERATSTDKDGYFESNFLEPGAYRITAVDRSYGPTRWVGTFSVRTDGSDPATVQVFAGRDYRWVDIVLHEQKVFTVQGVMRNDDGSPLQFENATNATIRVTMDPGEMFPLLAYIYPDSSGGFTIERVPSGTVRLATSAGAHWDTAVKEVEVNGDTEQVEIVLTRKAGPAPLTPTSEDDQD